MGLLMHIATLLRSHGQWESFNTQPHCWGVAGSGSPSIYCHNAGLGLGTTGQWDSFRIVPHCWGAVGSGTPLGDCYIAWEQWAVGRDFLPSRWTHILERPRGMAGPKRRKVMGWGDGMSCPGDGSPQKVQGQGWGDGVVCWVVLWCGVFWWVVSFLLVVL